MKTLTLTLCLLAVSAISSQVRAEPAPAQPAPAQPAPAQPARPKVVAAARSVAKVTTDRACAIYSCKDKAVFSVSVLTDGKPVEEGICHIKLKSDGAEAAVEKDYDLAQRLTTMRLGYWDSKRTMQGNRRHCKA